MNTSEFLLIAGAIVPDRPALLFEGQQFTFAQLQERVNRVANGLADLGVGKGDRVATMQVNCHQSIELYFAAALLDAIYVPLNFRAKAEELAQMLEIAGPKVLCIGERYLPLIERVDWLAPEQVITLDCPAGPGQHSYDELLESSAEELHFPEGEEDDTTVIMFTSGTTSVPKGVQLTHDSFASYLLSTVEPADPEVEETNLLTVPLYHIAGLQAALAAVYGGRTLAIMRQFEPGEWLTLAQECRGEPGHAGAHYAEAADGLLRLSRLRPVGLAGHHLRRGAYALAGDTAGHCGISRRPVYQRLRPDGNGVHHYHAAAGRPRAGRVAGGGGGQAASPVIHRQAFGGRGSDDCGRGGQPGGSSARWGKSWQGARG